MSKPLEVCFIPTNENDQYICLLCDYKTDVSKGYVGYCNHVKYNHVNAGEGITLEEYFLKETSNKNREDGMCGTCLTCGVATEFRSIAAGYKKYCSHTCAINNKDVAKKRNEATKASLMSKYGVSNPGQMPGHHEKLEKTCLERYGDAHYVNVEKARQTTLERYGVEYYTQTAEYKVALKEICLSQYGAVHHAQDPFVKEKIRKTVRERYGVDYALNVPFIREKIKATIAANGGYSLQRPEMLKSINLKHKQAFDKRLEMFKFDNVELLDIENRLFKCLKCGETFNKTGPITLSKSSPERFPRCLSCYPLGTQNKCSLFHQEVLGYLVNTLEIPLSEIVENDKSVLKTSNKELDLYVPAKKIAFELNGNIWHTEIYGEKASSYHLSKTEICESQGVRLVHIFEDEWIENNTLVKEKIAYLLNVNSIKRSIHARKCFIKPVIASVVNGFLEVNHLQGGETGSSVRLGAFHKEDNRDVLVAVMTFGQPRSFMGGKKEEGTWELVRFATDVDVRIPGIGSKLFSHFVKEYTPKEVFSYADRRWSTNIIPNVYDRLGFTMTSKTKPNYFYVHPNKKNYKLRENRYGYRKTRLAKLFPDYDASKTEWENMKEHGYDKIWDCGTLKYVWTPASMQV